MTQQNEQALEARIEDADGAAVEMSVEDLRAYFTRVESENREAERRFSRYLDDREYETSIDPKRDAYLARIDREATERYSRGGGAF